MGVGGSYVCVWYVDEFVCVCGLYHVLDGFCFLFGILGVSGWTSGPYQYGLLDVWV